MVSSKERIKEGEEAARGHHSWEEWEADCALESAAGHEIKTETTMPTFTEKRPRDRFAVKALENHADTHPQKRTSIIAIT